jgi:phosphoribosyl-AMP cyclohydrolase
MSEEATVLQFKDGGLLPAVIQHHESGEVLMVGYMDPEAVRRTQRDGTVWFWSRSRKEYWHKGDTSGNFLFVRELWTDCDADVVLARVEPEGPTCHTGARSCFFNRMESAVGQPEAVGESSAG